MAAATANQATVADQRWRAAAQPSSRRDAQLAGRREGAQLQHPGRLPERSGGLRGVAAPARHRPRAASADGTVEEKHGGPVRGPLAGRWPGAGVGGPSDGVGSVAAQVLGGGGVVPVRPDVQPEAAPGPSGPAQGVEGGGGRLPSGRGDRRGPGPAPGPGRPRAPLRHGDAHLGADGPLTRRTWPWTNSSSGSSARATRSVWSRSAVTPARHWTPG